MLTSCHILFLRPYGTHGDNGMYPIVHAWAFIIVDCGYFSAPRLLGGRLP